MKHLSSFESRGDINKRARILLDILSAKLLGGLVNANKKDMEIIHNEIKVAYDNIVNSGIDWEKEAVKSVQRTYNDLMKSVLHRYPELTR